MTKPTKWRVRPAKTSISLGIRPVWSESSLSAWRKLVSLATQWVDSKDSDQADLSPLGAVILLVFSWGGWLWVEWIAWTENQVSYCKKPKNSDNWKHCCNHSENWTMWICCRVMCPNNADEMANSIDPDETAVWSGSSLFAQTCLSKNLGTLW